MNQNTHSSTDDFLANFPKDEIIKVLKSIDNEISALHTTSSKDFMYFNQLLKNYYSQLKTLSENNKNITSYFTNQYPGELTKLTNSNKKQQEAIKEIKTFSEDYIKRVSLCLNSFNLLVVPCHNFIQNLHTLKFVLANLNLHLSYIKLNNLTDLKKGIEQFEQTIDKLLHKTEQGKSLSDSLACKLLDLKNNTNHHLFDLNTEYEKVVEYLFTDSKILTNNHFFSPSNYLSLNQYVQSSFDNLGEIITNIQYHDIIRQKMEHIQASQNELIDGLGKITLTQASQTDNQTLGILIKIPEIADIHTAQLLYTNKDYQNSIERITNKLIMVGYETKNLTDAYTSLTVECNQFNDRFIIHFGNTQQLYKQYCEHFTQNWETEFNQVAGLKTDYQTLKNHFSELFGLEKDLRTDIKNLKKLLLESGPTTSAELTSRLSEIITDLQANSNSIKSQFNVITNQLNELTVQSDTILSVNFNTLESIKLGEDITTQNRQIIEQLKLLQTNSHQISDEITASIKNIEYYSFFNNTVEEITKKLKYISQQISIENLKKLAPNNDAFLINIEKLYTMKSEREIHQKTLNLNTEPLVDTAENGAIDENDLELF